MYDVIKYIFAGELKGKTVYLVYNKIVRSYVVPAESVGFADAIVWSTLTQEGELEPPKTWTVNFTVLGEGGTLEGEVEQSILDGADCQIVTAKPNAHFNFKEWKFGETVLGTDVALTITGVSENMNVIAVFEAIPTFTVNFSVEGDGGTLEGNVQQVVDQGTDCQTVTAKPADGYKLKEWKSGETVLGSDAAITITNVTENMSVVAVFEESQFWVAPGTHASAVDDTSGDGNDYIGIQNTAGITGFKVHYEEVTLNSPPDQAIEVYVKYGEGDYDLIKYLFAGEMKTKTVYFTYNYIVRSYEVPTESLSFAETVVLANLPQVGELEAPQLWKSPETHAGYLDDTSGSGNGFVGIQNAAEIATFKVYYEEVTLNSPPDQGIEVYIKYGEGDFDLIKYLFAGEMKTKTVYLSYGKIVRSYVVPTESLDFSNIIVWSTLTEEGNIE